MHVYNWVTIHRGMDVLIIIVLPIDFNAVGLPAIATFSASSSLIRITEYSCRGHESNPSAHYHSDPNRGQLLISRTKNGIVRFRSGIVRNLLLTSSRKFSTANFPPIIPPIILTIFFLRSFYPFSFFFPFPFPFSNGRVRTGIVTPGTPRNGAVTVLGGKTTENNGKRPNKGIPEDEWLQRATRWTDGHWISLLWDLHHRFAYGLLADPRNRMTYCDSSIVRGFYTLVLSTFRYLRIYGSNSKSICVDGLLTNHQKDSTIYLLGLIHIFFFFSIEKILLYYSLDRRQKWFHLFIRWTSKSYFSKATRK